MQDQWSIANLTMRAPCHCPLSPAHSLYKHQVCLALAKHLMSLPQQNTTRVCITGHNQKRPLHLSVPLFNPWKHFGILTSQAVKIWTCVVANFMQLLKATVTYQRTSHRPAPQLPKFFYNYSHHTIFCFQSNKNLGTKIFLVKEMWKRAWWNDLEVQCH
jgi:hypothetical protein